MPRLSQKKPKFFILHRRLSVRHELNDSPPPSRSALKVKVINHRDTILLVEKLVQQQHPLDEGSIKSLQQLASKKQS